jgi:hypothetical protein
MVDIKEELERLIERIAAHRLRLRGQSERPAPQFEKGETGGSQAMLAAQQRAASKTPATNKKPSGERKNEESANRGFVSALIGGASLLVPWNEDRRRRRAYRREVLNHIMPRKSVDTPLR